VLHLDVFGQQETVLHLDVFGQQETVLHLEVFGQQETVLNLDVSGQQETVLHMDVSCNAPTPQGPELHLELDNRSLCCSWTYLHQTGIAAPGRV
jgi:hypothetical protein